MQDAPETAWGTRSPKGFAAMCIRISGRTKVARSVKKWMLRRFGASDGIVDIEHRGIRFRCHMYDNATERNIVISGDRENGDKLSAILPCLPVGGTFLDIGANCGLFSLMAAQEVGPLGGVIAIEPAPAMIARLHYNIAANGFANIVTVVEAAVGEAVGSSVLHINPGKYGASSLVEGRNVADVTVPMTTLAAVVAQAGLSQIDAIKIDVEGYEDRTLLPYFAATPPKLWPHAILMETKLSRRWKLNCLEHLIGVGYRIAWQTANDALVVRSAPNNVR